MTTIFFDITLSHKADYTTGIQRVVNNLSESMGSKVFENDIEIKFVVFNGYDYVYFDKNSKSKFLDKSLYKSFKDKLVKILRFLKIYKYIRRYLYQPFIKNNDIFWMPKDGDILFLADATWNYNPWQSIRNIKSRCNIKIAQIVYDLIPLNNKNLFEKTLVDNFERWWNVSSYYVDLNLCISKKVQSDVQKMNTSFFQNNKTTSIELGFDFNKPAFTDCEPSINLKKYGIDFVKQNFIMVGTLEPRKNHKFVIDIFDMLWRDHHDLNLIIVGKLGWLSDQIKSSILNHPKYNKCLFWIDNCNDSDLNFLYQHSDALIAASIDEGYGLPIIEAEARGINVIASNIDVFKEVRSSSSTVFFDLNSEYSLKKIIINFKKTKGKKIRSLSTWETCAIHIISLLKQLNE